jgi:hypothetical protein
VVSKVSDYSYLVKNRTGAFTLGESISNGTIAADQGTSYPTFTETKSKELVKKSRMEMDLERSGWRTHTHGEPRYYVVDFTTGYLTVYPKPDAAYTIKLTVNRYPITAMSTTSMSSSPEIDSKYHNMIIDGICAQAYLKNGEQTYDPKKSAVHMGLFTKAIADIRRKNSMFNATELIVPTHGGFI